MSEEKYKGTVKWFSNRSKYGFISPTSDNAPTKEDIFVHQTAIVTDASFATLAEGFKTSFSTYLDENGKLKAKDVTAEDGSPCPPGPPRRKRNPRKKSDGGEEGGEDDAEAAPADGAEPKKRNNNRRRRNNKKKAGDKAAAGTESGEEGTSKPEGENGKKPRKPGRKPQPSWFDDLEPSVQEAMTSRGIKVTAGRCFLAIGDTTRIKLGTGGYAGLAHSSGLLAEGTYTTAPDGTVSMTWPKVIKVDGSEWKPTTAEAESDAIVTEIKLTDESLSPTTKEDTVEKLWGEDKPEATEALEANGFMMRKMALYDMGRRRQPYRRNNRQGSEGGGEAAPAPAASEE